MTKQHRKSSSLKCTVRLKTSLTKRYQCDGRKVYNSEHGSMPRFKKQEVTAEKPACVCSTVLFRDKRHGNTRNTRPYRIKPKADLWQKEAIFHNSKKCK